MCRLSHCTKMPGDAFKVIMLTCTYVDLFAKSVGPSSKVVPSEGIMLVNKDKGGVRRKWPGATKW